MKNLFKAALVASALLLPAAAAHAAGEPGFYKDQNGNRVTVKSGGTLRMQAGSAADLSGPTFSTALTGNPLTQQSYKDLTVSTDLASTAMTALLASASGRTVYPGGGLTVMVSGSAATATALALECSDGTLIASWPIALLVDQVPTGPFASTAVTRGAGLTKGCGSGNAVMISNVGANITTTTHVYTNVPYTVQ